MCQILWLFRKLSKVKGIRYSGKRLELTSPPMKKQIKAVTWYLYSQDQSTSILSLTPLFPSHSLISHVRQGNCSQRRHSMNEGVTEDPKRISDNHMGSQRFESSLHICRCHRFVQCILPYKWIRQSLTSTSLSPSVTRPTYTILGVRCPFSLPTSTQPPYIDSIANKVMKTL
eukprot:TRINITY_DN6754_c0_g1_i4.p1 TRINITY_DN6754_c0_g1~~TRINITY_DN6754_c0_g1_i4.p1  ORF type:complete len:172 (+),score=0.09 TRINITY_DN6754_c0_g1_i4:446-961(+)